MNQPLVSIIVPVYNAANTLRRCVDSILSQKFVKFELLLINDGSLDESLQICNEYKEKDTRVYVYDKLNGGVSSARNRAIKEIRGEWVAFCDSDDWVNDDWLDTFVNAANDSQLIIQSFNMLGPSSCKHYLKDYYGPMQKGLPFLYNSIMPGALWNKMIKSSIILENHLFFNEQMYFREDEEFLLRLYPYVDNVRFVPSKTYNYVAPHFNNKYIGVFSQFIVIYKLLNADFYAILSEIRKDYIKELTYSLIDSYDRQVVNRENLLIQYKSVVGKNCLLIKEINIILRFCLSYFRVDALHWLLNTRSYIKCKL